MNFPFLSNIALICYIPASQCPRWYLLEETLRSMSFINAPLSSSDNKSGNTRTLLLSKSTGAFWRLTYRASWCAWRLLLYRTRLLLHTSKVLLPLLEQREKNLKWFQLIVMEEENILRVKGDIQYYYRFWLVIVVQYLIPFLGWARDYRTVSVSLSLECRNSQCFLLEKPFADPLPLPFLLSSFYRCETGTLEYILFGLT
jgi:hypothetical protein